MTLRLVNRQARDPVPLAHLARIAREAARRLKIRPRGAILVSFIDSRAMRRVNRRFLRHRGLTDVVCFRYDLPRLQGEDRRGGEAVAGEILVSPAFARSYAKRHGLSYRAELARYVVHGLLHWIGHDDQTPAQQRRMRAMEDQLLAACVK